MKSPKLNFSNLTGHGIKVAVVDSGIDGSHPKVGSVSGGISFRIGPGAGVACSTDFSDPAGHGTACAGLIRKIAPNVELYAIRVFDETLTAGDRALVAAIRWAVVQKMDIVNLSLGTTDVTSREAIASACKEAIKAGLILIASEHNSGLESYPSALPEVIGVTAGSVSGQYGYIYRTNHAIEIIARGDEQRLCWTDGREIVQDRVFNRQIS